jgi:Cys-tRNA(Pro) deacylase
MNSSDYEKYSENVIKVLDVLEAKDCKYTVRSFNSVAHHAKQAAALLDCPIGAVIKSLVFEIKGSEKYALVLVSGQNLVDSKKLTDIIGKEVFPAKPGKVEVLTGYSVGAVPAFGIEGDFQVVIDQDLMSYPQLWASAGSSKVLVRFNSNRLVALTGGEIREIKQN